MPRSHFANELLTLDNQICFALDSTARQLVRAYRPALEELELTHSQYLVMLVLWQWARDREDRPTVKALGNRLLLDSGTLTPLLKRLEARGLVTRTRSTEDTRELFVHLTRAGRDLKKRAVRVPLSLLRGSTMSLNELGQLLDHLKRLRAALQAKEATAAPSP